MSDKLSMSAFGDKIKSQYPEYHDMDSTELGQKMLAKYPEYSDMVESTPPTTSKTLPKTPDFVPQAPTDPTKPFKPGEIPSMGGSAQDKYRFTSGGQLKGAPDDDNWFKNRVLAPIAKVADSALLTVPTHITDAIKGHSVFGDSSDQIDAALQKGYGSAGGLVGGAASLAGSMATLPIGLVGRVPSVLGKIGVGAAEGSAMSGLPALLNFGSGKESGTGAIGETALGAVGGGVGGAVGAGLSKLGQWMMNNKPNQQIHNLRGISQEFPKAFKSEEDYRKYIDNPDLPFVDADKALVNQLRSIPEVSSFLQSKTGSSAEERNKELKQIISKGLNLQKDTAGPALGDIRKRIFQEQPNVDLFKPGEFASHMDKLAQKAPASVTFQDHGINNMIDYAKLVKQHSDQRAIAQAQLPAITDHMIGLQDKADALAGKVKDFQKKLAMPKNQGNQSMQDELTKSEQDLRAIRGELANIQPTFAHLHSVANAEPPKFPSPNGGKTPTSSQNEFARIYNDLAQRNSDAPLTYKDVAESLGSASVPQMAVNSLVAGRAGNEIAPKPNYMKGANARDWSDFIGSLVDKARKGEDVPQSFKDLLAQERVAAGNYKIPTKMLKELTMNGASASEGADLLSHVQGFDWAKRPIKAVTSSLPPDTTGRMEKALNYEDVGPLIEALSRTGKLTKGAAPTLAELITRSPAAVYNAQNHPSK